VENVLRGICVENVSALGMFFHILLNGEKLVLFLVFGAYPQFPTPY
jgi:hypothetical protein